MSASNCSSCLGDAPMLALVLLPRSDQKRLEVTAGRGLVDEQPPVDPTGSLAEVLELVRTREERVL
jgi:hypothetical protein